MKKQGLIIATIVIILVIAGGAFMLTRNAEPQTASSTRNAENAMEEFSSIKKLIDRGEAVQCMFSIEDEGGEQEWTMYIDGERVRGDYTTIQNGQSNVGGMINDTQYAYIWGTLDGQTSGTKIKVIEYTADENDSTAVNDDSTATSEPFDFEQDIDADCGPWKVDNGMFTPPSNIDFVDFSAQIEAMNDALGASGVSEESLCSICESLSDEARTTCLEAYSC